MDEMIVKSVDVMGDTVMATQDSEGTIWAGVSYFCKALGMNKGQKDRQVTNIGKDKTLSRGCCKFAAGVFDPSSETLALRLDFVPIWLAKISITERMQEEHPELADKLLEYQLKAKDILAEAFLPKQQGAGDIQGQIKLLAKGTTELYQRVESVESRVENLEDTMTLNYGQQQFLGEVVNKTVISILGGKKSNAYRYIGRKVFAECNGDLRRFFKVNARANVPKKRYEEAIEYAEHWKPCANTIIFIEQCNAQQTLNFREMAWDL